ncbi:MAG: protein-disulfide reductase DsbD N-terminal domain-containing protein [Pseudomonadota bacterium]
MKPDVSTDTSPATGGVSFKTRIGLGLLLAALLPVLASAQTLQSKRTTPGLNPLSSDSVSNTEANPLRNSDSDVLPVDEAFVLTAFIEGDRNLILSWAIQPGHYLYQDKLALLNSSGKSLLLSLPPATSLTDEFFGETKVYFDAVRLTLPLSTAGLTPQNGELALSLQFQGCAKERYCYPPQQKALQIKLPE